jgi:hypothetical protein
MKTSPPTMLVTMLVQKPPEIARSNVNKYVTTPPVDAPRSPATI